MCQFFEHIHTYGEQENRAVVFYVLFITFFMLGTVLRFFHFRRETPDHRKLILQV